MAALTLKQQKTFIAIRIIGGLASAGVLGYTYIANVLAGQPSEGPVLMTGLMAFAGLAYAGFYTRSLSKIAAAERAQGQG
jgi:hypothetical protein